MALSETEYRFLEQLYRAQYHTLFLYANAILKNTHLAEEAVQDTFHIACGKAAQVCRSENPSGWLVQTLKHVLKNMERSRSSLYASMRDALPLQRRGAGGVAGRGERGPSLRRIAERGGFPPFEAHRPGPVQLSGSRGGIPHLGGGLPETSTEDQAENEEKIGCLMSQNGPVFTYIC